MASRERAVVSNRPRASAETETTTMPDITYGPLPPPASLPVISVIFRTSWDTSSTASSYSSLPFSNFSQESWNQPRLNFLINQASSPEKPSCCLLGKMGFPSMVGVWEREGSSAQTICPVRCQPTTDSVCRMMGVPGWVQSCVA